MRIRSEVVPTTLEGICEHLVKHANYCVEGQLLLSAALLIQKQREQIQGLTAERDRLERIATNVC